MPLSSSREHYPVVVRRFVPSADDDETIRDLDALSRELAEDVAASRRVLTLFDLRAGLGLNRRQHKLQSDWVLAHRDDIRTVGIATGFLVTSPLVYCILTGLFWLAPPPTDYVVMSDPAHLLSWAERILEANDLPVPPFLSRALNAVSDEGSDLHPP